MTFWALAAVLLLPALLLAVLVIRLLRQPWLLGFVRGVVGLLLLTLASLLVLCAWDISHYRSVDPGEHLATLLIKKHGPQQFSVEIKGVDGRVQHHRLNGDAYLLKAQLLHWFEFVPAYPLPSGLRLASIEPRYLSMEQHLASPQQSIDLRDPRSKLDFALLLQTLNRTILVEASDLRSKPVLMLDGALYKVLWREGDLRVEAHNDIAKQGAPAWGDLQ